VCSPVPAGPPPLSALRTLATGFRDLCTRPAPPLVAQASPAVTPLAKPVAGGRPVPRIYTAEDTDVLPPTVVRQSFAALADVFALRPGAVEVIIDETGTVISATTRTSVNAVYDRVALATAKTWRYRPAMLNGTAVKFRAVVQLVR